ncbi:DDB1- and CUL4-associated factor 11 [Chironomus tepperi]|uniref:DDB1- and CUL4-associated factor 11 n=1 Tax=Chironomus tepperi TaxID=113505 RepID=UPI00391F6090
MGSYFSNMDNEEHLEPVSDSDDDLFQNIQDDDLSEHYLVIILRQLIDSGEIHLLSHNETRDGQLPKISKGPNMEKLKATEMYNQIKSASGFGKKVDETQDYKWSLVNLINSRQNNGKFLRNEKCKINNIYLPNQYERRLGSFGSKVFCGSFTRDGRRFVTGSQDQEIRIFDSSTSNYKTLNHINAKHVSWCILDIAFSPCSQYFAYSTWSECLHICPMDGNDEDVRCLNLNTNVNRFGAFALAFSSNGNEIICGGSDTSVYIFDRERNERTLRIPVRSDGHITDVNSVGFVDDAYHLFYSGSDDACIRVWDRRCLNENSPEPSGCLLGHIDGITYIDSKNDGRYLLSNSKDQSIKLWDLRAFSPREAETNIRASLQTRHWDYRWDKVPKTYYNVTKPITGDTSIVTFKGHRIQKSLIRAKFSPAATTGQRYIYTGCATGRLIIYDILTGKMVQNIEGHKDIIRDADWHPKRNEILTSSWDYSVNINTFQDKSTEKKRSRNPPTADYLDENQDLMDVAPPLRRSRRIAQRLATATNSRRN